MITLLKNSDYKESLWKNGKGKTSQIAIFPPEAEVSKNNFIWRISSATVTKSDPFSQYSGYERQLVVWKGNGLKLNNVPLQPNSPITFSGDDDIQCELIGADPVVDLGIIYDKKKVHAQLEVLILAPGEYFKLGPGVHFLILGSGEDCSINNLEIQVGETLRIENEREIILRGNNQQPVRVFHIALT